MTDQNNDTMGEKIANAFDGRETPTPARSTA